MGPGPFAVGHGQVDELASYEVHRTAHEVIVRQLERIATSASIVWRNGAGGHGLDHVVADCRVMHISHRCACRQVNKRADGIAELVKASQNLTRVNIKTKFNNGEYQHN
jgi:hypothetical protein